MKGYVYTFTGNADNLAHIARQYLGDQVWYWVADPAHLDVRTGYPADWKEQGAVFNAKGELRWHREGDSYRALLLTETLVEGLMALDGEWQVEKQHLFLQDLKEPRVHPQFGSYPTGKTQGRILAYLYKQDDRPVFVSLRVFKEG